MTQDPIERVFRQSELLAEGQCRTDSELSPLLVLDGPQGEAALRLDFSARAGERARVLRKARLMATALEAEACACLFQSHLESAGRHAAPVVVAIATDRKGGGATAIFARGRPGQRPLRRIRTPLAGSRPLGALAGLLGQVLPSEVTVREARRAWRELERMGVNIGTSGRALH